jgi:hypothetical protein
MRHAARAIVAVSMCCAFFPILATTVEFLSKARQSAAAPAVLDDTLCHVLPLLPVLHRPWSQLQLTLMWC